VERTAQLVYRRLVRAPLAAGWLLAALALAPAARADEPPAPELTEEQAGKLDLSGEPKKDAILPEAPPEAPPPSPRHKGFVLASSLGTMGFAGSFGNLCHPAFWIQTQLGYEIWKWLMVFAEGELAFTETSGVKDPSQNRGVPIFGFGGGARGTVHFTERVAMFLQADVGAMKADVAAGALATMGYRAAESLGLTVGGRLGLEWYQVDPHLALVLSGGTRYAAPFVRSAGSDLPLVWDLALALRYTF
jgi:hypothetical protein